MRPTITNVLCYRYRTALAFLYALTVAIGSSPSAFAQGDVINTRSGDPNASGGCVDGPPHPQYGSPDQFAVEDPTWKEMANDGYYALCVGSCSTKFAYCYKNPYFGGDSYDTKWDPERDGDPPLTMEDGSPVPMTSGNVPFDPNWTQPGSQPNTPDNADCTPSEEEPPICIAQALPSKPFELKAEEKVERPADQPPPFEPGTKTVRTFNNPRNGPISVEIEVDVGGGAPKENGLEVEWETWYHDLIEKATYNVHLPLKIQFRNDPRQQYGEVEYTVYPDGKVQWRGPGYYTSNGRADLAAEMMQLLQRVKPLPFPKGSKRPFVTRTMKFSRNMDTGEIKLGGPPNE